MTNSPNCFTEQPLVSNGRKALTDHRHSATFAFSVVLPLSRFFRPSAPIMRHKTNRKSSCYMCQGNMGKVITQSWNLLSGFHKPLCLSTVITTVVTPTLCQAPLLKREALFEPHPGPNNPSFPPLFMQFLLPKKQLITHTSTLVVLPARSRS